MNVAPTAVLCAFLLLGPAFGCSSSGPECRTCMREKCADLLEYCGGDADCACMADCLGAEGVPGVEGCLGTCGLTERPVDFVVLEACVATACPDRGDECATPSDYVPPDVGLDCTGSNLTPGGGSLADCAFDTGLSFDAEGTVLQLESADQNVCVRLERRDDGAGSLANTTWTLNNIRVGPLGEVALVDASDALCWYSSHHNFKDWVHVWTGTRHFDLQLALEGHSGARTYELYAFEQGPLDGATCAPRADGSSCIDGPIELFPVNL